MSSTATGDALAREAREGDDRALGEIFRDYNQPLYRYCLTILGNRQDAEDALQETMVKVLRSLPGEQREIALKPWLYRIAHNESIDLLRCRRASVSLEQSEPAAGEDLAEQVETRRRLRQLIVDVGALPERQRGALLMREAGGLDFDEIAAALETSSAVARQTLYEARLGLREMDAGREMDCIAVTKALSDGDRRVRRRRDIRAHLRDCAGCRGFAEEIDSRRNDLAAISPMPAAAFAALLHGVLGTGAGVGAAGAGSSGAAGASGGLGGMVGGAAAKSVGAASLLKGAATVAAVAAIGVGAADRGGLIHIGDGDPSPKVRSGAGPSQARPRETTAPSAPTADAANDRSARVGRHRPVEPIGGEALRRQDRVLSKPAISASPGSPTGTSAEGAAPSSPGKSGVEHPHGRGHAKQSPAGSGNGQETAASKGPEKSGGPSDHRHPVHPSHPQHPAKPAKAPAAPPAAPPPAEPASKSEGKKPE